MDAALDVDNQEGKGIVSTAGPAHWFDLAVRHWSTLDERTTTHRTTSGHAYSFEAHIPDVEAVDEMAAILLWIIGRKRI